MKKKLVSLALIFLIGLGIAAAAFIGTAQWVSPEKKGETLSMQRFENYYNFNQNDWQTVVDDPNWTREKESVLTVALKRTDGPTSCEVEAFCKDPSSMSWLSCGTAVIEVGGEGAAFTIPGNYVFKVVARSTGEGKSGYGTIQVSVE